MARCKILPIAAISTCLAFFGRGKSCAGNKRIGTDRLLYCVRLEDADSDVFEMLCTDDLKRSIDPFQFFVAAAGPKNTPRYLAALVTSKGSHCGILFSSQALTACMVWSEHDIESTIIMHLIGCRNSPLMGAKRAKID